MSALLVAGAIGAVASGYSAVQSGKSAKAAAAAQERMSAADLAFRREQYERYLGLYGPTEAKLAAQAGSDTPLDYDQMKAQIEMQTGNAERGLAANMAQRGFAGGGQDLGGMRGLAMNKANALTGAWAQGLSNRRNFALALINKDQIGNAARGVSGGMQNMANIYGNQANMYNQAATEGWKNFGSSVSGLARAWGQHQAENAPKPEKPIMPEGGSGPQSGGQTVRSYLSEQPQNDWGGGFTGESWANDGRLEHWKNTPMNYDPFDPWSTGKRLY